MQEKPEVGEERSMGFDEEMVDRGSAIRTPPTDRDRGGVSEGTTGAHARDAATD